MTEMFTEKRSFSRVPCKEPFNFIVLLTDMQDSHTIQASGEIIDISKAGIGITTDFPLLTGYILEWNDKHQEGKLHTALVRWSKAQDNDFRAGLMFI